jgi:hypothetical protein
MENAWHYQLRVYLADQAAALARQEPGSKLLQPLRHLLDRHDATLKCQFDAFADYVAAAEAEPEDQRMQQFPLYRWTKATIEDPTLKAKHLQAFAVRVGGSEVYAADVADALEADLQPLVGAGLIVRLSRHDTNPANNLPVPPRFRA